MTTTATKPDLTEVELRLAGAPGAEFDDIEWRIDTQPWPRDNGHVAMFVPYLKAHSVARLLDEWVGAAAWSDEYVPVSNGLECHLTILGVTKIDVGVAPAGEAQMSVKGIYSDAFKRCASIKWGVGRNVYQLEGLWAPVKVVDKGGKQQARETPESLKSIRQQYDALVG